MQNEKDKYRSNCVVSYRSYRNDERNFHKTSCTHPQHKRPWGSWIYMRLCPRNVIYRLVECRWHVPPRNARSQTTENYFRVYGM